MDLGFSSPTSALLWPVFPCGPFPIPQLSEEQERCRAWPSCSVEDGQTSPGQQAVVFKLIWMPGAFRSHLCIPDMNRLCYTMEDGSCRDTIKHPLKSQEWGFVGGVAHCIGTCVFRLRVLSCLRWTSKRSWRISGVVPLGSKSWGRS